MKISLSNKKFPIQETFNCKKVSVCSNSYCSPSKLCRAQHVCKSKDLLTLTIGRRIRT
ncbi:hypothetical protein J4416_01105 [Candidatus Pacearchaeota archaeon]|nr:hypothetical protein [Candidatus Pacearchaeota archaeon]